MGITEHDLFRGHSGAAEVLVAELTERRNAAQERTDAARAGGDFVGAGVHEGVAIGLESALQAVRSYLALIEYDAVERFRGELPDDVDAAEAVVGGESHAAARKVEPGRRPEAAASVLPAELTYDEMQDQADLAHVEVLALVDGYHEAAGR
jgi:hypothetical protein